MSARNRIWSIDVDISGDKHVNSRVYVFRSSRSKYYTNPTIPSLLRCQRAQVVLYDRAKVER